MTVTARRGTARPLKSNENPTPSRIETPAPVPRFRTILVEGCGWPTAATPYTPRRRESKR